MNGLNSVLKEQMPMACCDVMPTLTERLLSKKVDLEKKLAEINSALDALQKHPEVAQVLTLVGKAVGGGY